MFANNKKPPSDGIEMNSRTKYQKVQADSQHGSFFSIEDTEEDDLAQNDNEDVEISFAPKPIIQSPSSEYKNENICHLVREGWSTITFDWMEELLKKGNEKPLEKEDLLPLSPSDVPDEVYRRFSAVWNDLKVPQANKKSKDNENLLIKTFCYAFGKPFAAAGVLKFIHDSTLFMGPLLLNKLIYFLSDPNGKLKEGLMYVLGFFIVNLVMSLCLRQYFWWCYRVGMNLRSAVITSVYAKALIISPMTLARKTAGEITNLMSVDSTRLQELTPYLHAIWYSFFQIFLAMYFLWMQMGISCLAGLCIIILAIPLTGRVSMYMKTLQRSLSSIRDTRIKLTNEVLAGMKVIKLQAWEEEFLLRIQKIRAEESATFRKYAIAQSLSGALYTTIPIMVAIVTFITYTALGNTLHVATALTALALFEILRFPLFMLPNVLNNLIEAKVSVDRVESFLLSPERYYIPRLPLRSNGVMLSHISGIYDTLLRRKTWQLLASNSTVPSYILGASAANTLHHTGNSSVTNTTRSNNSTPSSSSFTGTIFTYTKLTLSTLATYTIRAFHTMTCQRFAPANATSVPTKATSNAPKDDDVLSEDESLVLVKELLLQEARQQIEQLEQQVGTLISATNTSDSVALPSTASSTRLLTLSNISLTASPGQLICIIGCVGSGKTSLLQTLLGNMHLIDGEIASFGKIAYAAQLPFIQNNTIQENILFGKKLQDHKYEEVLERSALLKDLEIFPAGDQTEIGERGINLSGGQKSRIGLARTLYSDADIYLLDDPLSAVDAHVGQHLFEHAILPLFQQENKCVLLVTNALQYVKYATSIIFLENGKIGRVGTFDDLLQHSKEFQDLMTTLQDTSSNLTKVEGKEDEDTSSVLVDTISSKDTTKLVEIPLHTNHKKTVEKSIKAAGSTLMSAEDREVGNVNSAMYYYWCMAAGGVMVGVIIIALYYGGEAMGISTSLWLSYWSQNQHAPTTSTGIVNPNITTNYYHHTMTSYLSTSSAIIHPYSLFSSPFVTAATSTMYQHPTMSSFATEDPTASTPSTTASSSFYSSPWFYLLVYMGLNVIVIVSSLGKEIYVRLASINAANRFFEDLLTSILYAPMEFYDVTPLGRIINRFSKDIYTLDEQIPATIRGYLSTMAKVTGTLLYIIFITPMFLLGLIPMMAFYVLAQRYYIKTSRELTRIENISRSPIYALFSETLDGMPTIRAYASEGRLMQSMYKLLNTNQQGYFLNFSANCWLAIRLEFLGTLIVTLAALFAVITKEMYFSHATASDSSSSSSATPEYMSQLAQFAGLAGLAVSLALSVTQSLNWTVRMASDMESQMVSVERIQHYITMKQEASHHLPADPITVHSDTATATRSKLLANKHKHSGDVSTSSSVTGDVETGRHQQNPLTKSLQKHGGKHAAKYWPEFGKIDFRGVNLRYREGLPLVLNDLTCAIKPQEKVGIVGRTGAGKSSIVTCLLRLVEMEAGEILIDGVSIAKIGLNTLRSVIAVIPQDPVLFSGTIRNNLDPFEEYTDEDIWEGLRRTLLDTVVTSLQDKVLENGSNYSVGQRQLLCITRALLSKAKIIVMDEATAAVDLETDAQIQRTIRREFADATCLTIAHRLNTILDSDKVLVMDAGRVAEFDTPQALLNNEQSMFYALVNKWESSNQ